MGDDSKDAVDKAVYNVYVADFVFRAVSLPFQVYAPTVVVMQEPICLKAKPPNTITTHFTCQGFSRHIISRYLHHSKALACILKGAFASSECTLRVLKPQLQHVSFKNGKASSLASRRIVETTEQMC